MTYTPSRAEDAAAQVKAAQAAVESADRAYRKGGTLNALNAANAKLAACHNHLYEVQGGVIPDDRGS